MQLTKTVVKRPKKENKSTVVTFRLTEAELDELNNLKEKMQFESVRDFFLFGMETLKHLHDLHLSNHRFFIRSPGEKGQIQEIEFEFKPDFQD